MRAAVLAEVRKRTRHRGVTLVSADFSAGALGIATLPAGVNYSRASVATTSDKSGGSVVITGIGVDVPRIAKSANGRVGLRFEESRTNILKNSQDMAGTGWTAGSATYTANAATGPDGNATADRVNATSAQFGPSVSAVDLAGGAPAIGTALSFSSWQRAVTSTPAGQGYIQDSPTSVVFNEAFSGTAWRRYERTRITLAAMTNVVPVDGRATGSGATAAARDVYCDLAQLETGRWCSEAIVTGNGSATRAGGRLWYASATQCLSGGRLGLRVSFEAPCSAADYSANARLWTIDANNYAELVASSRLINVVIGGSTFTTSRPVWWAPGDLVELWIECGGGVLLTSVQYRVNGGTVATVGTSYSAAQAAISPGANTLDLFCNGTASQLSALFVSWELYASGNRPSWATAPRSACPTITGAMVVSGTLSIANVALAGTAPYTYVWKRSGVAIGGATAATYTPVVADIYPDITCAITDALGVTTTTPARAFYAPDDIANVFDVIDPASNLVFASGSATLVRQFADAGPTGGSLDLHSPSLLKQPTYTASHATFGNQPVIGDTGGSLNTFLQGVNAADATSLSDGTGSAVFVVLRATTASRWVFDTNGGGSVTRGAAMFTGAAANQLRYLAGTGAAAAFDVTVTMSFNVVHKILGTHKTGDTGSDVHLYVDGVAQSAIAGSLNNVNTPSSSAPAKTFTLANYADPAPVNAHQGEIAYGVLIGGGNAVPTANERATLNAYALNRFGVAG
jgi:hypothetical protein